MKYKVLLLTAITFMTTCLGSNAKNILSIKESITDNAIVYPSSFETNTNEMMENWYLKNYAIIDESGIESRDYGLVSDAEYIRRLKAISTDDIEMPFNQIVKSYIERYVVKSRTLVAQMLGMCPYYMPIFEEALERHQMPLELKYIPIIESALNPNAVSPAGAGGLWQFMITTAKGVGLTVDSQLDERHTSRAKKRLYISSSSTTPTTTGHLPLPPTTAAQATSTRLSGAQALIMRSPISGRFITTCHVRLAVMCQHSLQPTM